MYVGDMAEKFGDRDAIVIDAHRESATYTQLDERSNQVARLCRRLGLDVGDGIAILLENSVEFFEVWWGAFRSGLYVTPVNWHLTTAEVTYLLEDSGARIVFFSTGLRHIVEPLLAAQPNLLGIQVGGSAGEGGRGVLAYEDLMANEPTTRIDAEVMGGTMFYSSGTTGRPRCV